VSPWAAPHCGASARRCAIADKAGVAAGIAGIVPPRRRRGDAVTCARAPSWATGVSASGTATE